ncbi:TetR/AcrR family transcriptional regulator [Actinomadura barringtoniae]|uniref:TetR/AcrR family transcriptional regulator n=1 Tax=Actinomadura barringtoniae TaxID=1427535 RepID=A0A939PSU0_9ACTN|nr:TetR/AcrR family transcriptional regulator [Actinomadura barringtoniae]MBO2455628.1 TetR/AcrR family transcriptional regulator [Actinomadura barringtoniae]
MSESPPRRLPRGRYALSRDEVERIQRSRLCVAMAEVMTEKGYVATSVEDVLKRAVISRQSFYQLFDSKLDCFMAAFDGAVEILLARLLETVGAGADGMPGPESPDAPMARFEQALTAYLDALAAEWPYARLFLVEVYAAGPKAVQRRIELQSGMSDTLASLIGVTDEAGRYTCQIIIAATSTMVTRPVAENDPDGLRAIGPPLIEHVRRLWECGAFGEGSGPKKGAGPKS